jgi:hypothetical protein
MEGNSPKLAYIHGITTCDPNPSRYIPVMVMTDSSIVRLFLQSRMPQNLMKISNLIKFNFIASKNFLGIEKITQLILTVP